MKIHLDNSPHIQTPREQRVHAAAQKFEALLLEQMLKPLAKQNEDSSGQESVMTSYGMEALSASLARQGGLGFAQRIEAKLKEH